MYFLVFLSSIVFILVTILVVRYLTKHDRGPKEPIGQLWVAFGFGFLALAGAALLEALILSPRDAYLYGSGSLKFFESLGVGIIEETLKTVPLALYIYQKRFFNEHSDGIIYFALSGLAFGLFENISYTISYGPETALLRLLLTPVFHAATASIFGYYLAKMKLADGGFSKVCFSLVAISVFHGLYNFGLISGSPHFLVLSLMITLLLTTGFFLYFMRSNELDKIEGLSASGKNKFCRYCGKKNKNNTLYCEYCGHKS